MAEQDGGRYLFATGLNNDALKAGAAQATNILRSLGDNAENEGVRIDDAFKKAAAGIGISLAGISVGAFVSKMFQVRSEFQDTESSMRVFLGSAEKAAKFMKELQDYSWYNMFEFSDLTKESAKLLAFGNNVETVIPILDKLSNIASGTKQPLSDLIDLYNKAKSIGKVDAHGLQSWGARGLVITDVLKEMGMEVDRSEVKFEHLEKAINRVTSEGGMFHGLMDEQLGNLSASWGQLQDETAKMFNEIGKNLEGAMKEGIDLASFFVKNYKEIGKTILELVAIYGTYRVTLAIMTAAQRLNTLVLRQAIVEKRLAAASGLQLSNAEAVAAARTKLLTIAQQGLTKAVKATTAAMMKNPYMIAAAAVAALVFGIYKLATAETAAEAAQRKHNEAMEAARERKENLLSKTQQLIDKINDETQTIYAQIKAWKELQKEMPEAFAGMTMKEFKNMKPEDRNKLINKTTDDNEIAAFNKAMDDAQRRVDALKKSINDAATMPSGQFGNGGLIQALSSRLREAEETLRLKKEEVAQRNEIIRLAEFEAKPTSEKLQILNDQLKELERQRDETEQILLNSEGTGYAWSNWLDKAKNEAVLDGINNKIKEIKGSISDLTPDKNTKKNKAYWKEQKEAAENARDLLDVSQQNSKEWNKYTKQIAEAEKQLEKYGNSSKKEQKELTEQEKLAEALLAFRSKNIHDEINLMEDGAEKKLKQITADFDDQKAAIEKQAKELAEANKKAAIKDKLNSDGLTSEQQAEIDKANKLNAENRTKLETDVYKSEIYAMRDYLKEYGTFQQQKLSIAKEYAEKIKKAQSEGERLLLEKQKQEAIGNIEIKAIKAQIDWTTVFGEFGGMFRDIIGPALDEAKKYIKTDDFKNSDQASQDALITAINQMEKSLGGAGTLNFKKLGKEVQIYQDSLRDLNDARIQEIEAINKLTKAQEAYEKVVKGGTEEEKKAAQASLESAQSNADAASANVRTQTNLVNQNQRSVSDTASKLKASMENVTEGLSKLASGGIKSAYDGLIQAGKGMGGAIGKIAKDLEDVPIVGWILSIINVLSDGLSNLVGGLLDAIFNAISGILSDVLSGDLFATLFKSIFQGIGSILNAISFGGWDALMGAINGGNEKEVAETTERLTASNKLLQQSIDALKDEIGKARGLDTVKAYEEAVKKQKEVIENTGDILAAQMGYHSAHHSNDYYISGSMSDSDWQRISKEVGKSVRGMSDLWNLSPEDLKKVSTLTDIWEKIYNGGKYDKSEYLDQYLELAGTLEEFEQGLHETLTQITFDSMYDSFVDTLMDMDASAEDFADNLSEYFMRAMLSNQIGKEYAEKLNEWYKKFAEGMLDGTLSDAEREALKNEYMGYVDAAIKERDELASIVGYGSSEASRSASSKGFASMSQDSADELNGRFTIMTEFTRSITENTNILVTNSGMILQHLSGIRDNTEFCRRLEGMDVDLRAIKQGIEDINLKGIKLKP